MVKKKSKTLSLSEKRSLIEEAHTEISVRRQCELLGIHRSCLFYQPVGESPLNLEIMELLDKQYTQTPFYGVARMHNYICTQGYPVNIKRIRRLLRLMGLSAIFPQKKTSIPDKSHKIYPYLLKGVDIVRPDHVWSTDITYIQMERGFLYLVAIIDWYSRYVISWRISNTLDASFCIEALQEALQQGKPQIFNTDQGSQFTCEGFTNTVLDAGVKISMDGKGRCLDNIFVERLWRTVKYEYVYINTIKDGKELWHGLNNYFNFYNKQRGHQSLDYRTPESVYRQ